jgi:hypothetical protein
MSMDLFAGIPVRDYGAAVAWYERLLGAAPSFLPNDTEAVWELADHRYLFIEVRPEHAGHAMHTVFVDDVDAPASPMSPSGACSPPSARPTPTACARPPSATRMAMSSDSAARRPDRSETAARNAADHRGDTMPGVRGRARRTFALGR